MVDILVNPYLCLNDEDVVLPNKKAPKGDTGWLTSSSTPHKMRKKYLSALRPLPLGAISRDYFINSILRIWIELPAWILAK